MPLVTAERLKKLAPNGRSEFIKAIAEEWPYAEEQGINTPKRVAHFLAQLMPESGGLRVIDENLNYSAKRLMEVWPSRFKTLSFAQQYDNNPEKLANYVYANRNGNGNFASGDGWRFRGGGFGQVTGRANYRRVGYEDNPDALRQSPVSAFRAAVDFWSKNNFNRWADKDDVLGARKAWNGGTHGLEETRSALAKAKKIFTGESKAPARPAKPKVEPVATVVAVTPAKTGTALPLTVVRDVQEKLRLLGYFEVGKPDGLEGPRTEAAILAFKNDWNRDHPNRALDLSPRIDPSLQVILPEAAPRQIAPERLEATTRSLRPGSVILQDTFRNKATAAAVAAGGGLFSVFDGLGTAMPGVFGVLTKIKEFATDVPLWAWGALALVIGLWIYRNSRKVEVARVEMHRSGEVT